MEAAVFIQDVYNITGIGVVPVVIVKKGVLKIGMKLNLNGRVMKIKIMEKNKKQIHEAHETESVGLGLSKADYKLLKSALKKEVIFSDTEDIVTDISQFKNLGKSNHPKGPLKSLFSKFFG